MPAPGQTAGAGFILMDNPSTDTRQLQSPFAPKVQWRRVLLGAMATLVLSYSLFTAICIAVFIRMGDAVYEDQWTVLYPLFQMADLLATTWLYLWLAGGMRRWRLVHVLGIWVIAWAVETGLTVLLRLSALGEIGADVMTQGLSLAAALAGWGLSLRRRNCGSRPDRVQSESPGGH